MYMSSSEFCILHSSFCIPMAYSFPKSLHLRKPAEFAAVYDGRVREARGPLLVYARPNELGHPRVGLSTSRKVGNAVRRNRIRRLLREAFRLMRHDLPGGYDLVVVVRPHEPLMLADYQRLLSGAAVKLHRRLGGAASPAPPAGGADARTATTPGPAD